MSNRHIITKEMIESKQLIIEIIPDDKIKDKYFLLQKINDIK